MIFKRLLSIAICSLIAFPPHLFAANQNSDQPPVQGDGSQPQPVDPKVESFLQDLESGRIGSHPAQDADIFHLTGQEIDIFEKNQRLHFDLNERQVEIPYVAFTALKLLYDAKTKSLFFDAFRGVDKNGENGVLVARQTIKNVDILTSAQDAELFQFVDSNLKLHVIDMGLVATQVFKSPIAIFQNLWQPDAESIKTWVGDTRDIRWTGPLKSGFLTRGTKPLNLSQAVLVPHAEDNSVRLTAGDFYVSATPSLGGDSYAYAIFSRDTTYAQMAQGYKILQWQAALLSTKTDVQVQAEKIIEGLQNELDKQELSLMNETISPEARLVISSLNPASVAGIKAREGAVQGLKGNTFDTFTPQEWTQTYSEVAANAKPEDSDRQNEEQWYKVINKVTGDLKQADEKAARVTPRERLKMLRDKLATDPVYKSVAIALSVSTPYLYSFLAPYIDSQFEVIQQLKVVGFAYEHFIPAVLKDAAYRTPVMLSMLSLAAIWPEAVLMSSIVGKTLRQMAEKVKTQTSRKAVYIKDLAHNWGNLSNWQRITSFGMRGYAWLILPYWRVLIQYMAQQKTFFSAVNNGINPMQKILADSDIGRKLGLTEDQRVGLNKVFGADKQANIERNFKIQGAIAEETQKLDSIALLVAATLVAEKHKLDPALLMMLGQESQTLEINKVSEILNTPEKRQEWEMITNLLIGQMSQIKKGSIIVDQHMSELISQYYKAGEEIARKLDGMSDLKKKFLRFRMAFSSKLSNKLKAAANFAVADHEFLKRVYTDDFVSQQVQKEFTIDHIMVVGLIGLYGARADLSHPEHLSADPNGFLWTAKQHWFDIFQNTFAHFFVAGASMALVFQKIKPQVATNYAPIEDYQFVSRERTQGLISGVKDWTQVFNPVKSDLGGIIIKRFTKRFTTLTASITLLLAMRVGLFHYPLLSSLKAWTFSFIAAQWIYGWIWDPVQRGNQMEEERIDEMNLKLKVARRKINRGDFAEGRAELHDLYARYNKKVLSVFDLEKMSKTELLMLSVDQPPVYTKANRWTSWFTTWVAAAGSTVMAIPLSVIVMDEKLINAPSTWYEWIPLSIGLYTASYFMQAKYATKYYNFYLGLKAKLLAKTAPLRLAIVERREARAEQKEERVQARAAMATARSCENLFSPTAGFSFRPTFR